MILHVCICVNRNKGTTIYLILSIFCRDKRLQLNGCLSLSPKQLPTILTSHVLSLSPDGTTEMQPFVNHDYITLTIINPP